MSNKARCPMTFNCADHEQPIFDCIGTQCAAWRRYRAGEAPSNSEVGICGMAPATTGDARLLDSDGNIAGWAP